MPMAKSPKREAAKPTPRRRKRDRDATGEALLNAAVECFARDGFDAATTKSVAERAGVSEGLIHRYFKSKDGLLLALMRRFLEDDAAHPVFAPQAAQPMSAALPAFFEAAFAHHDRLADAMRVMVS